MQDSDKNKINPVDVHIGNRIKSRRNLLGLTQENLAKDLGITFQQVQKYERGINRLNPSRLMDISQILKTSVQYLFEGLETPSTSVLQEEGNSYRADSFMTPEIIELVRSFNTISESHVRRQIIALVKTLAKSNEKE